MRLAAGTQFPPSVREGITVHGYLVGAVIGGHPDAELRYAAHGPDGTPATLVTSRRRHTDRRDRSRFRRLSGRRRDLEHPALIPVRHIEEHGGHPVLIMGAYPVRTFGDLLDEEAPLAPERVVELLTPVAEAIDLAHSHDLVHRALGIDSLLVEGRERLLLDSFGLVVPREDESWGLNQTGDVRYRPPEQVRGQPLEPAGNVYSLTAVIVHALSGAAPYGGERPALYSHLVDPPPAVSERASWLGPAVDRVVARGMAKDPSARHGSAGELLNDLSRALGSGSPVVAAARASRQGQRRAAARRVKLAVPAVLAAAALCGAIAAVALDPFGDDARNPRGSSATSAWNQLAGKRAELRDALATAATPRAQAEAAAALAAAYRSAARAPQLPGLASAARAASGAYANLASGARAGDANGYTYASAAVIDSERRVTAAARGR